MFPACHQAMTHFHAHRCLAGHDGFYLMDHAIVVFSRKIKKSFYYLIINVFKILAETMPIRSQQSGVAVDPQADISSLGRFRL
jgi:hypothetical protein